MGARTSPAGQVTDNTVRVKQNNEKTVCFIFCLLILLSFRHDFLESGRTCVSSHGFPHFAACVVFVCIFDFSDGCICCFVAWVIVGVVFFLCSICCMGDSWRHFFLCSICSVVWLCVFFFCVRFVALSEDEIGRAVVRVVRCFEGKGMQPLFGRLV